MQHKLTPKQIKAIYLLSSGKTMKAVSKELKLRRETLWSWKQLPAFAAELELVMTEMRGGMRHRLIYLLDESITNLCNGVNDPFKGTKRMRVAISILKLLSIDKILHPDSPDAPPDTVTSTPDVASCGPAAV